MERLIVFAALFATFALLERASVRSPRFAHNLCLGVAGAVITRLLLGWLLGFITLPRAAGLLSGLAPWLQGVLALVILDFAVWLQHRVSHVWTPLWRLHQVHHTDTALDVSSAVRFHPLEIALSALYKTLIAFALGASLQTIMLFDVILNGCALFNHARLRIPAAMDRVLRMLIVTPSVHLIHHSVEPTHQNKNFGFSITLWDRLFGTYAFVAPPAELGCRGIVSTSLWQLIKLPFVGKSVQHADHG